MERRAGPATRLGKTSSVHNALLVRPRQDVRARKESGSGHIPGDNRAAESELLGRIVCPTARLGHASCAHSAQVTHPSHEPGAREESGGGRAPAVATRSPPTTSCWDDWRAQRLVWEGPAARKAREWSARDAGLGRGSRVEAGGRRRRLCEPRRGRAVGTNPAPSGSPGLHEQCAEHTVEVSQTRGRGEERERRRARTASWDDEAAAPAERDPWSIWRD